MSDYIKHLEKERDDGIRRSIEAEQDYRDVMQVNEQLKAELITYKELNQGLREMVQAHKDERDEARKMSALWKNRAKRYKPLRTLWYLEYVQAKKERDEAVRMCKVVQGTLSDALYGYESDNWNEHDHDNAWAVVEEAHEFLAQHKNIEDAPPF